jgi:hypothetical protein
MDIGRWLRSLGLEEYETAFRQNKVDAAVVPMAAMDEAVGFRSIIVLTCGDFHDQVVVVLAAIFIDHPHRNTMGAGFEVAWKPRRPDMR